MTTLKAQLVMKSKNPKGILIMIDQEKVYWYEMTQRPVSIGCQPKGFIDFDDNQGEWGIVAYDRELDEIELDDYDIRVWNPSN